MVVKCYHAAVCLALQGNNLSGEMPAGLGNLPNLQYLFLQDNYLSGKSTLFTKGE